MNDYFIAVFEIIRTGHWITDQVSKELKEFGIYEPQYNVLRILRGATGKPVSVNNILEKMVQPSSNVTRIVDKLAARGLVDRQLCPDDRRKMDITITEAGKELLKKLDAKVHKLHEPMMQNLTQKEAVKLKDLIRKLKGNQN